MPKPNTPNAPDFAKQYGEGLKTYLKFLPEMLSSEMQYRQQYMPQEIQNQQALQAKYGPVQIQQQLSALKQMDPQSFALRQALGAQVARNQARGYVDPLQNAAYGALGRSALGGPSQQDIQAIRARQASTGNITGNAPGMAEAVYTRNRQNQMLTNFYGQQAPETQAAAQAGTFLSQPSQASLANQVQGITAPTGNLFVNPNAGYQGVQFGLQNYQNTLAQGQSQSNPWMGALSGAASGAATGAAAGPYGMAAGALIGGLGGYFSDSRLKKNVSRTGFSTRDGIPIVTFEYVGLPTPRLRGVLAQDVEKVRPDAVTEWRGLKLVDYDALGIRLEAA